MLNFFFFYIPLFAFGLIEQMEILLLNYPVSLFDPSTSGRGLFTYIVFLKMRVKTGMEFGEAFYLFSPPKIMLLQYFLKNFWLFW